MHDDDKKEESKDEEKKDEAKDEKKEEAKEEKKEEKKDEEKKEDKRDLDGSDSKAGGTEVTDDEDDDDGRRLAYMDTLYKKWPDSKNPRAQHPQDKHLKEPPRAVVFPKTPKVTPKKRNLSTSGGSYSHKNYAHYEPTLNNASNRAAS